MLGRRALIRYAARSAVVGAMASPLVVAACGVGSGPGRASPTAASRSALTGGLKLPAYIPFQGPKPDLEGNSAGVPPAYFAYPKNPVKTISGPVGKGED